MDHSFEYTVKDLQEELANSCKQVEALEQAIAHMEVELDEASYAARNRFEESQHLRQQLQAVQGENDTMQKELQSKTKVCEELQKCRGLTPEVSLEELYEVLRDEQHHADDILQLEEELKRQTDRIKHIQENALVRCHHKELLRRKLGEHAKLLAEVEGITQINERTLSLLRNFV